VFCVAGGGVLAFPGALIGALLPPHVASNQAGYRYEVVDGGGRCCHGGGASLCRGYRMAMARAPGNMATVFRRRSHYRSRCSLNCRGDPLRPAVLVVFQLGTTLWAQTIHGQEWTRYRNMVSRKKALERGWPGPGMPGAERAGVRTVQIGVDASSGEPFDLDLDELRQHLFIPGASGTGKTTTIVALADGVLANGYGAVFVDFKGSGLGAAARQLAERHGLPFTVVDPHDPNGADTTLFRRARRSCQQADRRIHLLRRSRDLQAGCDGVSAHRLPGSRGCQQSISLDTIYETLRPGGLTRLARQLGDEHESLKVRLEDLDETAVSAPWHRRLQRRLGALMEGAFGDMFASVRRWTGARPLARRK